MQPNKLSRNPSSLEKSSTASSEDCLDSSSHSHWELLSPRAAWTLFLLSLLLLLLSNLLGFPSELPTHTLLLALFHAALHFIGLLCSDTRVWSDAPDALRVQALECLAEFAAASACFSVCALLPAMVECCGGEEEPMPVWLGVLVGVWNVSLLWQVGRGREELRRVRREVQWREVSGELEEEEAVEEKGDIEEKEKVEEESVVILIEEWSRLK